MAEQNRDIIQSLVEWNLKSQWTRELKEQFKTSTNQAENLATGASALNTLPGGPYSITVILNGTGTGTVTSIPAGIDCGDMCTAEFDGFSATELTAEAAPDCVFEEWLYDDLPSGDGNYIAFSSIDARIIVVATFTATYSLTVVKTGTGTGVVTSDFGGMDCGDVCTANFPADVYTTLTATPDMGSVFTGWRLSDDIVGDGNTLSINTIQGNHLTVTAIFS